MKQVPVKNSVLRALSRKSFHHMFTRCEQIDLSYGDILSEPGERIRHVYFPNSGLISLLTVIDGHESVAAGMVGSEGMAGMSLLLGIDVSPARTLVQGAGTALRMKAAYFGNEIRHNLVLRRELNHYLYAFIAQVSQTAACNRHHLVGQRLARWLLMTHDRMRSDEFRLTQDFLAHMLGVRRVGVSKAAALLQKMKLIRYTRGHISILNRKGLERESCRCYKAVNDIRDKMLAGHPG
ncbi:MAG: Crp/Fnr family transcriptional regulator [Acidiferrobacterales bacterium]